MHHRNRWRTAVFLCVLVVGCDDFDALRREKQIKTYWALTRSGIELTELSQNQPLTTATIEKVVRTHLRNNQDFWGNPIVILSKGADSSVRSYVLVSMGSDGKRDYKPEEYFKLQPHSIRRSTKLDVIVRDGKPISLAGK